MCSSRVFQGFLVLWMGLGCGVTAAPVNNSEAAISSAGIRVAVSQTSGALVGLSGSNDLNLVSLGGSPGELWRAELEKNGGSLEVSPDKAGKFSVNSSQSAPHSLSMTWGKFPGLDELEVLVHVELPESSPCSTWHIRFSGLDGIRILKVRFPRVVSIVSQPGESLSVPMWMGQRMADPRKFFAAPGAAQKQSWAYPGLLSMQCAALSVSNGIGLYTACDDAASFRKELTFVGGSENRLGFEWGHYPEFVPGRTTSWELPYKVIIAPHEGDWFEAAERYRSWATNQPWARNSRLARGQVPEWVSKTGVWVWNRGRSTNVLEPAAVLHRTSGLPVSVFWHWWHGCSYDDGFPEYLPPREGTAAFEKALANAQAEGLHALVYMNQRLWGMETASWKQRNAEKFAVKGSDGKVHPEFYNSFTHKPCASMCMGTPFWRNVYAGLAVRAIDELGVDGIYMDQACTSLSCYDPGHPHPAGGGKYWISGFQRLARDIRYRAQGKKNGDAKGAAGLLMFPNRLALAGEGTGEGWLPYLDIMLSLQVSKERYAGDDRWETIPFFHAVYHPYFIPFGNYSSLTMPPYDDLWPAASAPAEPMALLDRKYSAQFLLEQARAFVWGQQPTIANFLPGHLESRAMEIEYVTRLAGVRMRALPYLLYGTMLRAPSTDSHPEMIDFSRLSIYAGQHDGIREFRKASDQVIAAEWRAPDGRMALALASIAPEPIVLKVRLEQQGNFPKDGVRPIRIDQSGRKELARQRPPNLEFRLAPRDACVVELR